MRRLLVPASLPHGHLVHLPRGTGAYRPPSSSAASSAPPPASSIPETAEGPEARMAAIRAIVKEIVDVPAAAQLSLGPNWSARTAAERDEFVRLFADLLERSLISAIAGRIRLPDGVQVGYVGESVDGAVATVWTTIADQARDGPPVHVPDDGARRRVGHSRRGHRRGQRGGELPGPVPPRHAVLVLSGARPADAGEGAGDAPGSLVAAAIADGPAIAPGRRRPRGRATRSRRRRCWRRPTAPPSTRSLQARDRTRACGSIWRWRWSRAPSPKRSLADECGRARGGRKAEPIAPRREARSRAPPGGSRRCGPRPPRTASPTGCRSAPSRAPRRPGAWPHCSSRRSLQARADRQPSRSRGPRTFC